MSITTAINDNFNRADSNTVGNGWSQSSTAGAPNPVIKTNKLQFGGTAGNVNCSIYQSIGTPTFPISMASDVDQTVSSAGARASYFIPYYASSTFETGVGARVQAQGTTIDIVDGTTSKATGTYSMSVGTRYYIWVDILDAGGGQVKVNLYINTSNSKPGSATLASGAFTPTNSGTNSALYLDATNGGTWTTTNVLVQYGSNPTGGNFLTFM